MLHILHKAKAEHFEGLRGKHSSTFI